MYKDRYPLGIVNLHTHNRENLSEKYIYMNAPAAVIPHMPNRSRALQLERKARQRATNENQLDPTRHSVINEDLCSRQEGWYELRNRACDMREKFVKCAVAHDELEALKEDGRLDSATIASMEANVNKLKSEFERSVDLATPIIKGMLEVAHKNGHTADKYGSHYDVIFDITCSDEHTMHDCVLDLCEDTVLKGTLTDVQRACNTLKYLGPDATERSLCWLHPMVDKMCGIYEKMKANGEGIAATYDIVDSENVISRWCRIMADAPHYPLQYAFEKLDACWHNEPYPEWDYPEHPMTVEEAHARLGYGYDRKHKRFSKDIPPAEFEHTKEFYDVAPISIELKDTATDEMEL